MHSTLRWIVPNRLDRQFLAVSYLLVLTVAIVTTVGNPRLYSIASAAVCSFFAALLAISATVGTRSRSDIKASIPLLLLALLCMSLMIVMVEWNFSWNSIPTSFENRDAGFDNNLNYRGLVIFLAVCVATLPLSMAFSRTADRLLELPWLRKQNRVRLLIYFVLLLFACSQVQKQFQFWQIGMNPVLLQISGAVLVIPTTYLLCRVRRWWVRLSLFLLLFVATWLALISMNAPFEGGMRFVEPSILASQSSYFLMLMLLLRLVSKNHDSIPERQWPSLWGFAAIGMAIFIVVTSSLMDLAVASQFGGKEGLEFARFIRRLQQTSGVDTQYVIDGNRVSLAAGTPTTVAIFAEFSSKSDRNYFAGIAQLNSPVLLSLMLYDMNPNVETTAIKSIEKQLVTVGRGSLTSKQLLDLTFGCQYVYVNECQFENSHVNPKPGPQQTWPQNLGLYRIPSGQVAIAVNALQTAGFNGTLQLHACKLNDDDWRAIGGLENAIAISVHDCLPPASIEVRKWLKEKPADQNNIQIGVGQDVTAARIWSFIDLNFRIGAYVTPFESEGETWDALFVGGLKLFAPGTFLEKLMDSENLNQDLVDFHLVFDPNKNPDAIRHVVIPIMNDALIERTSALTDLEILSFDTDWIDDSLRTQSNFRYHVFNLQPLGKLTSLKELYLPRSFYLDNFQVFAKLPNLDVLQFDAFHDARLYNVPNVKAEFFPNLKQIRLFSEPHPKLLLELAKIKQLERVDMINSEEWFETAEDQEKLKSIFDERVDVRFLKTSEYPDPPESFRQHLKQVKQDVRKRRMPISEQDSD